MNIENLMAWLKSRMYQEHEAIKATPHDFEKGMHIGAREAFTEVISKMQDLVTKIDQ